MPRSATAASAASPPASWRAWRRSASRRYGYGIRYDYGLFRQDHRGRLADRDCPRTGSPTAIPGNSSGAKPPTRSASAARVECAKARTATPRHVWLPGETRRSPSPTTRRSSAGAASGEHAAPLVGPPLDPILLDAFNAGDHVGALAESTAAESISRVLYPADATPAGQELRLRQEYLLHLGLAAGHPPPPPAAIQRHPHAARQGGDPAQRHPSGARRRRADAAPGRRPRLDWDEAWDITAAHLRLYQPHPAAGGAGKLAGAADGTPAAAPHADHLSHQRAPARRRARRRASTKRRSARRLSLIDESDGRRVRMGYLAFVGSHKINGVSALHTDLMKRTVFPDLHRLFPDRIINKTNGITPRRWLFEANPGLTELLVDVLRQAPRAQGRMPSRLRRRRRAWRGSDRGRPVAGATTAAPGRGGFPGPRLSRRPPSLSRRRCAAPRPPGALAERDRAPARRDQRRALPRCPSGGRCRMC